MPFAFPLAFAVLLSSVAGVVAVSVELVVGFGFADNRGSDVESSLVFTPAPSSGSKAAASMPEVPSASSNSSSGSQCPSSSQSSSSPPPSSVGTFSGLCLCSEMLDDQ